MLKHLCCTILLFVFTVNATVSAEPRLWPATSLDKVLVSDLPDDSTPSKLVLYGAKGEIVSGQAVFTPGCSLDKVSASISDLRQVGSRAKIAASDVKLQWVRYIDVQKNSSRIPLDELDIIAPNPMPDPFWEDDAIPVKTGTFSILDNSVYIAYRSQPLWIEIHVPDDAAPGDYSGTLTVDGSAEISAELPVTLHVYGFEMPNERHQSVVTWWNLQGRGLPPVKLYSDNYWKRLKHFAEFVVEHRQTDAGIVPLSIVEEKGSAASGYRYDTANLERYAEICFDAGIRQIHMHSVGRLSESDAIDGVGRSVLNRSRSVVADEENMRRLPAIEAMAKRRGWEGRFLTGISDEPFMHNEEAYAKVVELAHETAPAIRIIEAVEAEYLGDLDIYCPKINHLHMWYDTFKEHQEDGSELWYYTSRIPVGRYPGRFVDQSLTKMRVQFWALYLHDLDGFLFWALNSPYADDAYSEAAIGNNSPLGNPVIAYPGRNGLLGSLRFSAQRDGLEDYEYLWTLEARLAKLKERVGKDAHWLNPRQRSLELCRRVMWDFVGYTRDPAVMLETRQAIAEEIEALDTEPLLYVQTSPPEGTSVPAGPRNVGIRGLAAPGAKVWINGDPVNDIRQSGYFRRYHFLLDDEPEIVFEVEHKGKRRTVTRRFIPEN